ncbi:hypothetical protein RYA05_01240 [Pseudomonas syringae pv. actinidiae]|nr:hypothetical protein [Pseudomonas syringae pv. actinidiae]
MGILYFHCGDYDSASSHIEVLGSLEATGTEMESIGRGIIRPDADRHVFSNDNNLYNGLCLAILNNTLSPNDIVVVYSVNGREFTSGFDNDACLTNWHDGLFDQMEKNLLRLITKKQAEDSGNAGPENTMQGTLYLHCGEIVGAPTGVEILGSLTETQKNMTIIGTELLSPEGDRHVFSNSDFVFQGLRFSLADGALNPNNVAIMVHHEGTSTQTSLGTDGELLDQPKGMFDQLETHFIERLKFL